MIVPRVMKLSTRSTYGMRALVELALAQGQTPVSAALIAKRQLLSVAYLEQLLHRLKKEGVVHSVRGPRGGYVLAKGPRLITMGEVVRVLDGSPEANGHQKGNGGLGRRKVRLPAGRQAALDPTRHAEWIAGAVWRCVHERLAQSLDGVTLQDVCDEVKTIAGEPLDHRFTFHI